MGIPGMLSYLNDKHDVFKRKSYRLQAKGGNGLEGDCRDGPCIIFDSAVLPLLIYREWERYSKRSGLEYLGYMVERGGWETQFRAFAARFVKELATTYQCTVVWVLDGGVNKKPSARSDRIFETLNMDCAEADKMVECEQAGVASTCTVAMTRELRRSSYEFETYAVTQAIVDIAVGPLANEVLLIEAAANCTDGKVWRQAENLHNRFNGERKTFIVSCDTDMLFFGDTSPDIGVVLLQLGSTDERSSQNRVSKGADWSCDVHGIVSSKFLRFTYCNIAEDIAGAHGALGVEACALPVLATLLGSDLCACEADIYDFTVAVKSALLNKHFADPEVTKAFKTLNIKERHEQEAARRRRKNGQSDIRGCKFGKNCRRPECALSHPKEGNMFCTRESENGRCLQPRCHFRHAKPIAFGIRPSFFQKFRFPCPAQGVFDTWGQAVQALLEIQEEQKKENHGVGINIRLGLDLECSGALNDILRRRTVELVKHHQGRWTTNSGKLKIKTCVQDVCLWLRDVSASSEGRDDADAFTRTIKIYDLPSVEEDLLHVNVNNQD